MDDQNEAHVPEHFEDSYEAVAWANRRLQDPRTLSRTERLAIARIRTGQWSTTGERSKGDDAAPQRVRR